MNSSRPCACCPKWWSHVMAGDCDLLLRVVAADLEAYRRFQIAHLTSLSVVQNVKTEVPMEKIKLTTELPV